MDPTSPSPTPTPPDDAPAAPPASSPLAQWFARHPDVTQRAFAAETVRLGRPIDPSLISKYCWLVLIPELANAFTIERVSRRLDKRDFVDAEAWTGLKIAASNARADVRRRRGTRAFQRRAP